MAAFHLNLNIQTMIGLFFMVLCFTTGILGFLLYRYEFLDGKSFFFSRTLGVILMLVSMIVAGAAGLVLVYVRMML